MGSRPVAIVGLAILLAGCGGGFNPKDDTKVTGAVADALAYCAAELQASLGSGTGGDGSAEAAAIDALVEAYKAHPDEMRPVLVDAADDLRRCAPDDAARLRDLVG